VVSSPGTALLVARDGVEPGQSPVDHLSGTAVAVSRLSKSFSVPHSRRTTVRERVIRPLSGTVDESFLALDDVSFEVFRGERFGIVGPNGSGKSTLMRCISGIYRADSGSVRVSGRLAPFIELGVGFNPELSARHNVLLGAVMLGLSPADARARVGDIAAFAGVEEFLDMKLKNFSTGMVVRLAFAVTVEVDADVLLFDEVLAVGDAEFQAKCKRHFDHLRSEQKTLILVTHQMEDLREHCDRVLLLRDGRVVDVGDPDTIARRYESSRASRVRPPGVQTSAGAGHRPGPRMLGSDPRKLWTLARVLAVAEFRLRYLDSALSYLWALAGPLAWFAILWVVFTHVTHLSKGVPHYALCLLTAFMLWTFFATATATAVPCLVQAGDVLRKAPVPHLAIPLAVIVAGVIEVAANLVAVLLLLVIGGVMPRVSWLELPVLILLLSAFAFGCSLLLSALFVRHRDVDHIWILVRQALFYLSPIIYVIASAPASWQRVLLANPLGAVITQARHALIDPAAPSAAAVLGGWVGLLVPLGVTALVVALGCWVFMRESPRAAENL
jgi:ABC-type polysaccharide/polyol phosphate transport system ATPase subunit/ABC-type polysaccharide/polyol phosphate export permease